MKLTNVFLFIFMSGIFLLFFSCQKEEFENNHIATEQANPVIPLGNSPLQNSISGFSPNTDCFIPKPIEGAITDAITYYNTKGSAEDYFFPVVPNMFGEPIWEAYWRFEDEDNPSSMVTVVPTVKGGKQNVESIYFFYEKEGEIASTTVIRRYDLEISIESTDLGENEIDGLLAMEEMFVGFDMEIFCGDDGGLRCGGPCGKGWFARFLRWLKTKGAIWWMTLWTSGGSGSSVPFAGIFDFGGGDNAWFYMFIASLGGGGAGNYGPPPPSVFEQPESLSRLCELIESDSNGEFYDIDPTSLNEILAETEIVSEFCDTYGNVFYCDQFSAQEIATLIDLFNNGSAPIVEEISDYFDSQGCDISQEEKECLMNYAYMAGSFELGLKKFQMEVCSFLQEYDLVVEDLQEAETDFNECLLTSSVLECLEDDPDQFADCTSWDYIPVGPPASNPNYQSCGVTGIHVDFNTLFLNEEGKWEIAHVDYTFETLYFEYPRIREDGTFIPAGQAALLSAVLADQIHDLMEEHYWGQKPPSAVELEIKYFSAINAALSFIGGRVTNNPHYGPVPIAPYQTRLFHNGNCY